MYIGNYHGRRGTGTRHLPSFGFMQEIKIEGKKRIYIILTKIKSV
jgi:hypothetical protein